MALTWPIDAAPRCRRPSKQQQGSSGHQHGPTPPFTAYWRAAITNCIGPACGLEALKYISYPAQARQLRFDKPSCGRCRGTLLTRLVLPPLHVDMHCGTHSNR